MNAEAGTTIAVFSEFTDKLAEFKKRYDNVVYDLEIPEQLTQAKSDARSIGKINSRLDAAHKVAKAPHKEKCDEIDLARKTLKDGFLLMQGKIIDPIKQRDQAIVKHAEVLQKKVDDIRAVTDFSDYPDPTAEKISKRLDFVNAININGGYEDRKADATLAQVETIKQLEQMLQVRLKYEKDGEELTRLRLEKEEREQVEREDKIRREAAERARRDAKEKAEREQQEQERIHQEQIDKIEADRVEAEREQQIAVEEAEARGRREVEEREEKKRIEASNEAARIETARRLEEEWKAKKTHRDKIEKEAIVSLHELILEYNGELYLVSEAIIDAIKESRIKHVSINY